MTEQKEVSIKPEDLGEGGKGTEKQEVGGRCFFDASRPHFWTCWKCGFLNYGSSHPKAYVCRNCGAGTWC